MKLIVLISLFFTTPVFAKDPTFSIKTKKISKEFKTSELLKRKDLEKIKLVNPPAYIGETIVFSAIPIVNLFKGIDVEPDEVIVFKALDGFSAPLTRDRLLNTDKSKSQAYLAVESPNKWPILRKGKPSAGPFYLIWKNPKASQIVRDEWPYMLASFEVSGTLKSMYPKIFPQSKNKRVLSGFNHFLKNCFACHKINGQGASKFGPDLNRPMNPTEYFKLGALKKYIREPKSVRDWAGRQMQGFTEEDLNTSDINDLVGYLRHISKHKRP